jgi:hypothetical protein
MNQRAALNCLVAAIRHAFPEKFARLKRRERNGQATCSAGQSLVIARKPYVLPMSAEKLERSQTQRVEPS